MSTSLIIFIVLTVAFTAQGSVYHLSNEYDYSQRTSRPSSYTVNLALQQRIANALSAFNSKEGAHHDAAGCALNHGQDPDLGEVVQSAAYPQVTIYHANYHQQPQWTQLPLAQHNGYPYSGEVNRIRGFQRNQVAYPHQPLHLEGVSPSPEYGYHYPSAYAHHLYK